MVSEVIIVGAGASIKPYISALQPVLDHKLTILTNYAYKTFPGTFLCFQDRDFYKVRPEKSVNPDIYNDLKELPLIVGVNLNGTEEFKLDNTVLLDKSERENLTGIFALKLALRLINTGTIYLLGFDWNRRLGLKERDPNYNPKSNINLHYYDDIKHWGTGYYGYYEGHNPDNEFSKFIKDGIKIYNVSLESNINCFEKINYEHMFTLLNNEIINQEELRKEIRRKLCTL